jgi:acyl-CoA synthetase (AMP-forming)/AMP-acid ligase II
VVPAGADFRLWTWAQLHERSGSIAHGLAKIGVAPGDRCCVFVRPGLQWIALVHGLFQLGAVPVLIDPGMGRRALLECVGRIQPRVLIAVPRVHFARWLFPAAFKSVEIAIWAGGPRPFGAHSLAALQSAGAGVYPAIERAANDEAAILFTSGSTGPAKGVVYEHGMFNAQVECLRKLYTFEAGSTDLACFPLFALLAPALKLCSVFPQMDFARPAEVDPAQIVTALQRLRVRSSFGSPAIWRRVIPWCEQHGVKLESLRQLMIAGAPIEADLVRRARALLRDDGEVFTPYGATEALPVAHVPGLQLAGRLGEQAAKGAGTAVGRAVPGVEIRLIKISDALIPTWDDALCVGTGDAGEIVVRGANVTRAYKFDELATAAAKIVDGDTFWHRMGDLGRMDAGGVLWFLGRKSQRMQTARGTLFPVPLENVFERHPAVGRCAVVGVGASGAEIPVLVVEEHSSKLPRARAAREELSRELLRAGLWFDGCSAVERVLYKANFPLDARHQAKIDRGALKLWAQDQVR